MSTTGFGDIQYTDQPSADTTTTAPSGTNGAAQEVVIDPNDPLLTSEALDMNLDANAYDVPPPPPDGTWRAKLKQVDINDKAGKPQHHITGSFGKPGQSDYRPFFAVNVESHLIDQGGKFDDVALTEYWVKTAVGKRQKISQAASIGVALGLRDQLTQARTQADVLAILEKGLSAEPLAVVQTRWEASCRHCDEKGKKSGKGAQGVFRYDMTSFAADGKGGRDPMTSCPSCGARCRAQARVVNYLPASAKVTQGLGK